MLRYGTPCATSASCTASSVSWYDEQPGMAEPAAEHVVRLCKENNWTRADLLGQ